MAIPPGGKHPERTQNGAFEAMAEMYPGQVFYIEYEGCAAGSERRLPDHADGRRRLRPAPAQGRRLALLPGRAERVASELDRLAVVHGLTVPAERAAARCATSVVLRLSDLTA